MTEERQQKLEKSANELASFQEAEGQLRPWLMEKELMMSVLGPLSIDPNMLNAQKQQVQVSLGFCLLVSLGPSAEKSVWMELGAEEAEWPFTVCLIKKPPISLQALTCSFTNVWFI